MTKKIDQSYVSRWRGRTWRGYVLVRLAKLIFAIGDRIYSGKSDLVIFPFWGDTGYAGNSKHLFEFLLSEGKCNPQLLIYNKELFANLHSRFPDNVLYAYSKKAFIAFFKAKVVVISSAIWRVYFLPYYLSNKRKFILNLWHGVPLKRLAYQIPGWRDSGNNFDVQIYSQLISSSSLERLILSSCFRMCVDDIPTHGVPRNDVLKCPDNFSRNAYLNQHFPSVDAKSKILLYAPTWRDSGEGAAFFPFDDIEYQTLETFLVENDLYVFLRGHHIERKALDTHRLYGSSSRIISSDAIEDTQELLLLADMLITDYSSIYFDYLLLERPIIFVPYDAEIYEEYRGFMLKYAECTPGPKIKSFKQFKSEIINILKNPDDYTDKIIEAKHIFHSTPKTNACPILAKAIIEIMALS